MYEAVRFQLAATNSPTSWTSTQAPPGLTFDATAGEFEGAPTASGVFDCIVIAINSSGSSLPVTVTFGIEANSGLNEAGVEIDFDLSTGKVTRVGAQSGNEAVLFGKRGDHVMLLIGLSKSGILRDLPVVTLDVALKEYETEERLFLTDGNFTKVGYYELTRYRLLVPLLGSLVDAALSDSENDAGTQFVAQAEIQISIQHGDTNLTPSIFVLSSQSFPWLVARDMIP